MYPTLVLTTPSVRSYSYCGPQNHPTENIAISVGGVGGEGGDGGGEAMAAVWDPNCILWMQKISRRNLHATFNEQRPWPGHCAAALRDWASKRSRRFDHQPRGQGMTSNPFHLRTPRALPHDGSIRRRPAKSWPCPPIQPSNISNATTDTPLAQVLGSCGHNAFNTWRHTRCAIFSPHASNAPMMTS